MKRTPRRGVVLLLVLALLAMFALMATAFVLMSQQAASSARSGSGIDQTSDSPSRAADQALNKMLTEMVNGLYGGNQSTATAMNNPTLSASGQVIEADLPGLPNGGIGSIGSPVRMLTGNAAGESSRIVGISAAGKPLILPFPSGTSPNSGDQCLVDPLPFPVVGNNDFTAPGNTAMLPAPALQANGQPVLQADGTPLVFPSYHRGSQSSLRPTGTNFNGSNPAYTPGSGPWDVSNGGSPYPDSIFVDPGLPSRFASDGKEYKPQIAVKVIPLDGRLNVNAHGCLAQAVAQFYQPTSPLSGTSFAGGSSPTLPRGQGYGPADTNLNVLFANPSAYQQLLQARYGSDGQPGRGGNDPLIANKWFNYPVAWGSPADTLGCGTVGLNVAGFPMFIDMGGPTVAGIPYAINLSRNAPHGLVPSAADNPFSVAEFERVLRLYDRDAPTLPDRLFTLLGANVTQLRDCITSESWDLPTPSLRITDKLTGVPVSSWAALLPAEVLAGLRMDLNRSFGFGKPGDPFGDVTLYNKPGSTVTVQGNCDPYGVADNSLTARQAYARNLYVMMMALTGNNSGMAPVYAQWAVNAVDFCDRDSIMTPFPYCTNALTGNWSSPDKIVWGCERPELLLMEAIVLHDRRTEVVTSGQSQQVKQGFRPQGTLIVELYNPSPPQEGVSAELAGPNGGVDLTKVAPGGSPVWRIVISKNTTLVNNEYKDPDDPNAASQPAIDRVVYFCNQTAAVPAEGQVKFFATSPAVTEVPSGGYAVIGSGDPEPGSPSRTKTYIGLETTSAPSEGGQAPPPTPKPTTRYIDLDPASGGKQVVFNNEDNQPLAQINPPSRLVINSPRRLSVTEPVGGYPADGFDPATERYTTPKDGALDTDPDLKTLGTKAPYCIIYLQRLANPLAAWNATTNPYRTIDAMPVDLTVFNGVSSDPTEAGGVSQGTTMLQTRQRGEQNDAPQAMNLWKQEPPTKTVADNTGTLSGQYYFNKKLGHTLGYLNSTYGTPAGGSPQQPFPWLTWNNRPFISQLELMLVPAVSSSKLLARYDYARPTSPSPYAGDPGPFPHLLNFFSGGRHQIFEFVGVPSRFVGTEIQGNPQTLASSQGHPFHPPFNRISLYREPGRINLNVIPEQQAGQLVFTGLMNGLPGMATPDFWQKFDRSRKAAPFQSYAASIEKTLLRPDPDNPNRPLFQFDGTLSGLQPGVNAGPFNDPNRNPYFRFQAFNSLANRVTTRSNVFAIWITIGYFEASGNQVGAELGADTGDVQRHRIFYIVDRTLAAGSSPGIDLNNNQIILVKRVLD